MKGGHQHLMPTAMIFFFFFFSWYKTNLCAHITTKLQHRAEEILTQEVRADEPPSPDGAEVNQIILESTKCTKPAKNTIKCKFIPPLRAEEEGSGVF